MIAEVKHELPKGLTTEIKGNRVKVTIEDKYYDTYFDNRLQGREANN